MSIAAGLSFTGCGNSSNGGSTGSSFEQVPLISDNYGAATCSGSTSNADDEFVLDLFTDGTCLFSVSDETNCETYAGKWSVTQLTDNTYQIEIKDLTQQDSTTGDCTMKCNGLLKLTIPADKLEDYRAGYPIYDATLEGCSFTHTASNDGSCKLGESSGATSTFTITLTEIRQKS